MPSKNLSERLLRGAVRIREPLSQHYVARRLARGIADASRANERRGMSYLVRPVGPIIWFHVFGLQGALNLVGVMQRICEEIPEITCLVTSQDQIMDCVFDVRMPEGVLHQYAPFDKPAAVKRFLDYWSPSLCIWTDDALMPVMIQEISERGMSSILANIVNIDMANPHISGLPNIVKPLLQNFSQILASNLEAKLQVERFGATAKLMGALCEEALALPHDEKRRSRIAKQLDGRPVWLAVGVCLDEIDQILAAQKKALSQTHRLLLIIVPKRREDVDRICNGCKTLDLHFKKSNDLDEIPPRTEVIVAKGFDGVGLWYQIAAVCFVGGSLGPHGGHNPLEVANFGSAIIHGPHVDNYANIYMRLRDAGAAIEIASVTSLVKAVTELVIPDRAAAMAHAGWMVSSEGAKATDALVEVIWDYFPMGAAP